MTVTDTIGGVSVEIGFGVNAVGGNYFVLNDTVKGLLDNATYLLAPDDVFVVVSTNVALVETDRGRDREIDEYKPGFATVVFNDDDRTFDPAYGSSPYAGQITPMRRIRIAWNGTELFAGWISDWIVDYEPGDQVARVTASCVDALGIIGNQEISVITPAHSGDLTGVRIARVLDRFEVDFPADRDIDVGNTTLGSTTFGQNALTYLQAVAKAEAGYLFVAADGTLTFRNRLAPLNTDTDLVISDDPNSGIPYTKITQRSSTDLLYTRVTGTSETTTNEVQATNSDAAAEYLMRTLALGTLLTLDDAQTQGLVDYYLERFSTIELRFQSATINLAGCTTAQVQDFVRLDLTDVVLVERSPLNVGGVIQRLSMIDGIRHHITPGSWLVDVSFSNADARSFLMLDDVVYGDLDANRLAF